VGLRGRGGADIQRAVREGPGSYLHLPSRLPDCPYKTLTTFPVTIAVGTAGFAFQKPVERGPARDGHAGNRRAVADQHAAQRGVSLFSIENIRRLFRRRRLP
jgi:hypothetical protein